MGTPEFAVGVLKKLVAEGKNIVGVITSPDKPAGRGRKVKQSDVKSYAVSQNLKLLQPSNLKEEYFLNELAALKANLQIVVAFRMLPKVVWNMPSYGTFNLHASLLPQYRGAAPINWSIINRELKTGVSTFFIDDKIDTGEIILQEEVLIKKRETVGSLHDVLMNTGSQLVIKTVELITESNEKPIKQNMSDVLKNAPKLTKDNTKIDWSRPVEEIDSFIRGLNPYPSAWCTLNNNNEERSTVKIYNCNYVIEKHNFENGTIISSKKELKISASNGYLNIYEMQLAGKRKIDIKSLLNGFTFEENSKMV